MRINLKSKNLEVTPALHTYIEAKILKPVKKLLKGVAGSDLPVLDLEFSRTTRHHQKGRIYRAEANLTIGNKMLRAVVEEEDIRVACDLLEDGLVNEIKKFKNRTISITRRGAMRAKKDLRLDPRARFYKTARTRNEGN